MLNYFIPKKSKKIKKQEAISDPISPPSALEVVIACQNSNRPSIEDESALQLKEEARHSVDPESSNKNAELSSSKNTQKKVKNIENETTSTSKNYWPSFIPSVRKKKIILVKETHCAPHSNTTTPKSEVSDNKLPSDFDPGEIVDYLTAIDKSIEVAPLSDTMQDEDVIKKLQEIDPTRVFNNKIFSYSPDLRRHLEEFTVMLKDIVNGVPIAVNDLGSLLDRSEKQLDGLNNLLPKPIKLLVTRLQSIVTKRLPPDKLTMMVEKFGMQDVIVSSPAGIKLVDLAAKNGFIISLLKRIMDALRMVPPAVLSTEVMAPMAIFVLMIMLWYCHKRGREDRLKKENSPDGPRDVSNSDATEV